LWKIKHTRFFYFSQAHAAKRRFFTNHCTEKHNINNFFSIYDGDRNLFVQTSGWDAFTFANPKFPIAYEIVGNVMDCLMNIPLELPSLWIHQKPLGCMNDYCENKNDVILKLRTGDICQSCLSKIKKEGIDDGVVNQVIRIFEAIRTQHLFKQGFIGNMRPLPVFIDDSGKLSINNREIRLNPIESTLFIFFLMNSKGISLNDLSLHKVKLLNIYRVIRPAGNETAINELIRPYHEQGTFSVNKARLNSSLRRRIGEPLANFYLIERDSDNIFKINIDSANVIWGGAWRDKGFTISY